MALTPNGDRVFVVTVVDTVDEILTLVNVALGTESVAECPAGDLNGDALISVDEILSAVHGVLGSCIAA